MFKQLSIIIFFALVALNSQAQRSFADSISDIQDSIGINFDEDDEEAYSEEGPYDELFDTVLSVRKIEILPDTVKYWKNKKEFAYVKNLDSLLKDSEKKEQEKKQDRSDGPNFSWLGALFNGVFFKTILWIMAAIFVVVVLSQLIQNKGIFKKRFVKPVEEEVAVTDENILEQDFESLINKAKKDEDYRLATRFQFLKTLQRLKEKELIEFSLEKTNSLYVREVPERWRNDFARLILNYEYVWYGNFALTLQQYEQLQQKYNSFNEKI